MKTISESDRAEIEKFKLYLEAINRWNKAFFIVGQITKMDEIQITEIGIRRAKAHARIYEQIYGEKPMISLDEYQIIETGERMCYKLQSVTKPQKPAYRVDLIANRGAGECSCRDFSIRRAPAIRAGQPLGTRAVLCKHLVLARRHFLNALLAEIAQTEQPKR